MSKTARSAILVIGGFVLGVMTAGAVATATIGRTLTHRTWELQRQVLEAEFVTAYRLGDYRMAACAMSRYTAFTSALLTGGDSSDRRKIQSSIALAYGRLAKAADGAGSPMGRDRALEMALTTFRAVDAGVTTKGQVAEIVAEADRAWDRESHDCADTSVGGRR